MRSLNRPLTIKHLAVILISLGVILLLSGCEGSKDSAGETENKSRLDTYETLVKNQPAETMSYSPTRDTKNFWIKTWGKKGALSYVYLINGNGEAYAYYIFQGLPVSYCTSLVPPVQEYKVEGDSSGQAGVLGPAPSVDGTFSSGSNCDAYYGKDAVSGGYVEFIKGMGISMQISNHPMAQFGDAKPFGDATFAKVD